MKTRKTFGSVRGSSIRNLQVGMSLLGVFALLSLGVLGSGCSSGGPGTNPFGQCSKAKMGAIEPGEDFTGCVLNGKDLIDTTFSYSNFEGAQLNNAIFWHHWYTYDISTLIETRFNNVEAQHVDFTWANLYKADFRPIGGYTDLRWAIFHNANLYKADLRGADLEEAEFIGATLTCADLSGVQTNLKYVDFSSATLINTDLSGTDLTGVDFSYANMTGANLNGTTGPPLSSILTLQQQGQIVFTPSLPGACP